MFFIERLCGILIYTVIVLIFYALFNNHRLSNKHLYLLFAIVLSVMAMFYTPYKTSDLSRTYDILETISKMDFSTLFNNILVKNSNPAIYIYYWLISKMDCFFMLPGINCFICYSFIFYVIKDMEVRFNISSKTCAATVLFTMFIGNYMPVISGIKMMLALSMLIFSFYREFVQNKFTTINVVLYIIALFTHNIVIVILFVRLIVFLVSVNTKLAFKIILVISSVLTFAVMFALFPQTFIGIFDSGKGYLTDDKQYYDIWEYIIAALVCIYELVVIMKIRKLILIKGNTVLRFKSLNTFMAFILALSVIMFGIFSMFHRLSVEFGATLIIPLIMISMEYDNYIPSKRYKPISFRTYTTIFSLLIFSIAGSRGTMSALKFFEL